MSKLNAYKLRDTLKAGLSSVVLRSIKIAKRIEKPTLGSTKSVLKAAGLRAVQFSKKIRAIDPASVRLFAGSVILIGAQVGTQVVKKIRTIDLSALKSVVAAAILKIAQVIKKIREIEISAPRSMVNATFVRTAQVTKKVRMAGSKFSARKLIVGTSGVATLTALILVGTFVFSGLNIDGASATDKAAETSANKAGAEVKQVSIIEKVEASITKDYPGIDIVIDEDAVPLATKTFINEKTSPTSYGTIADTLVNQGMVKASAYALTIDGQEFATVASTADAEAILSDIKAKYAGPDDTWSGEFQENVQIKSTEVALDALTTTAAAVDYLLTGGEEEEVYTVQDGDTIWDVSIDLGLSPEEIAAANKGYNIDKIHTGDEIKLNRIVPFIHYETTGVVKEKESIEYTVKEEQSDSLYIGETEVVTKGVPGKRLVTTQEVLVNGIPVDSTELDSETLKEPVDQVVKVGTKEREVVNTYTNTSVASTTPVNTTEADYSGEVTGGGSGIVSDARRFIGVPYRYGGSSPKGFDCSGFTSYVYKLNGLSIPRTAASQSAKGKYIPISKVKAGDIVCFGARGSSHHVGIYIGGGKYIHAPYTGAKVRIQTFAKRKPNFAVRF
jgi:cell wall-associated NlpC family hydrolase